MSQESDAALQRVRAAKPVAEKIFTNLLGEVAIGITRVGETYGLKVNLVSPPASTIDLPTTVNGVPVRVEVTGPITKRTLPKSQTSHGHE